MAPNNTATDEDKDTNPDIKLEEFDVKEDIDINDESSNLGNELEHADEVVETMMETKKTASHNDGGNSDDMTI